MDEDGGWTVVQSKQHKKAVSKTKQAIKRIVGEKSMQEASLHYAGKRKLEDNQASEKRNLSGWGMWTFPDETTANKNKNKKQATGDSKPATTPKITLQKTSTPASLAEDDQQNIIQIFSQKFPNTYRGITDEEAIAVLQANSIHNYDQEVVKRTEEGATPAQAQLIFTHHLRRKTAKALSQLEQSIPLVVEMYDKKQRDILDVARIIDLPPVTVFRILLIGRKLTTEQIDQVMLTKEKSKFIFLSPRDNEQLQKARDADVITRELLDTTTEDKQYKKIVSASSEKRIKRASEFEKKVEEVLVTLGVSFLTEEDIRTKMGGVYATPDFVVEAGVNISGTKVYWIDAKAFFGSDMDNIRAPLIRQSSKYNEVFGPGAVVFQHGFTQSLASALSDVILISASQLGIKK